MEKTKLVHCITPGCGRTFYTTPNSRQALCPDCRSQINSFNRKGDSSKQASKIIK